MPGADDSNEVLRRAAAYLTRNAPLSLNAGVDQAANAPARVVRMALASRIAVGRQGRVRSSRVSCRPLSPEASATASASRTMYRVGSLASARACRHPGAGRARLDGNSPANNMTHDRVMREFGAAADPRRQLGGPGPLRRKRRWGPPGHAPTIGMSGCKARPSRTSEPRIAAWPSRHGSPTRCTAACVHAIHRAAPAHRQRWRQAE